MGNMLTEKIKNRISEYTAKHRKALCIWAVALVSGVMIFRGFMQLPQIKANQREIAKVEEQIKYEKNRQKETDELMTQVDSDEYIERVASEKLGLVKSNAKIYIDVSQEQSAR